MSSLSNVKLLIPASSTWQVLLTDFFGNVQNIELTESKERSSLLTENDTPLEGVEPITLDPMQQENDSQVIQQPQQLQRDHTFEIGDPGQSQTWRYVAFVALSIALGGALVTSSFVV